MNTTSDFAHSAKDAAEKLAHQAQDFARRDPALATATAVGVALGWHLIPTRFLFRSVATAASALARPALLCLGALKIYDLYQSSQKPSQTKSGSEAK